MEIYKHKYKYGLCVTYVRITPRMCACLNARSAATADGAPTRACSQRHEIDNKIMSTINIASDHTQTLGLSSSSLRLSSLRNYAQLWKCL